jgi:hypothetical protein
VILLVPIVAVRLRPDLEAHLFDQRASGVGRSVADKLLAYPSEHPVVLVGRISQLLPIARGKIDVASGTVRRPRAAGQRLEKVLGGANGHARFDYRAKCLFFYVRTVIMLSELLDDIRSYSSI